MEGWLALLAAVAGAMIALAGQHITRRGEQRSHRAELLVEQCATLLALSGDFRNRVWEERDLGLQDRVGAWDLAGFRLAAAKIAILCTDERLNEGVTELRTAGSDLGHYWRTGSRDDATLDRLSANFSDRIDDVATSCSRVVGRQLRPI
jgi:hypothetical protein